MDQHGYNANKFPKKKLEKPLQTRPKTKTCENMLQLVQRKGKKVQNIFHEQTVEINTKNPGSNSTKPIQKRNLGWRVGEPM